MDRVVGDVFKSIYVRGDGSLCISGEFGFR